MLTHGVVIHTEEGDFQVVWEDGVIYLGIYPGGRRKGERLGEIGCITSAQVVLCDTRWIYLAADWKELLRMDESGNRRSETQDGAYLFWRLVKHHLSQSNNY